MSIFGAVKLIDTAGAAQGVLFENGCPTVRDYFVGISEGDIPLHSRWEKIGYTPTMNTTESDIWSAGGLHVNPAAATPMAVIGGANDDGTPAIYSGTATGGSTTTLIDTGKNFTTVPVVAGDCIVLAKSGDSSTAALTPEWGYVTSLTGTDTLNVAGGFSSGGTGSGRTYSVVQKALSTGAQVVKVEYLTAAYLTRTELVITNGAAEVNLVNSPFRVNSFRVVASGSLNKAVGAVTLKAQTPTATIYSYISAGYTRARNSTYCVPAATTLFITVVMAGFSLAAGTKWEYARMYLRQNREPSTGFATGAMFYNLIEIMANNSSIIVPLILPIKVPATSDIKMSGIASETGVAVCSMRGWLET